MVRNLNDKFDSKVVCALKGIAIILMVCNHLYPIPEWIFPSNQYISLQIGAKTLASYWGGFSKICVAIFAFLSGIGMYYTYKKKKSIEGGYKYNLNKLRGFLTTYWLILILFYLPIMSISGVLQFKISDFILNLFAIRTSYIRIAWYVRYYIVLVVSFPIYMLALKNKSYNAIGITIRVVLLLALGVVKVGLSFLESGSVILEMLREYVDYTPIVLLGYYFGEVNAYERFFAKVKKIRLLNNLFAEMLVFAFIFLARGAVKDIVLFKADILYAPVIVYISWRFIVRCCGLCYELMSLLGKYSLEIWFLHAIFFIGSESVQKIAYWPKYSVLILPWTLCILLPVAAMFQKAKALLTNLESCFRKKIHLLKKL